MTTEMTVSDAHYENLPMRPATRHDAIMATNSIELPAKLAEFSERRRIFREWVLSNMVEGVHFGIVPGTGGRGGNDPQYRKLPSLYQPGADLIIVLMEVRAEFEPDPLAWQQLGGKPGTIAYKCRLFSRDGALIGEGNGADRIGNKQRDEHAAVMMACKRAKVSAVRTTYSLTDLFSQDLEDLQREPHANPEQRPDAPVVQPRGDRVTAANLTQLFNGWKKKRLEYELDATADAFREWQQPHTGIPAASSNKPELWTTLKLSQCYEQLEMMQ